MIMLFVATGSNSITATQLGGKTYDTIDACLDAARAAADRKHFSNTSTSITPVAFCAPQ
jgi:hypothetical protein